jgi:hypothetical protein
MSVYATITGSLGTYRISGKTCENVFPFRGRLRNTPQIEEQMRGMESGDRIRDVTLEIDNADSFINIASESLRGKSVSIVWDGYSETWSGKIRSLREDRTGLLALRVVEDALTVMNYRYPDETIRITDFSNLEARSSNRTIPIPLGGTTADPIRIPGVVVDRLGWVYLFCVGQIQWRGRVFVNNVEVSTGFTVYLGTSTQAVFPGFVVLVFSSDPTGSTGAWPEVVMEITGLRLGSSSEDQCRNPIRQIQYLLTTARTGVNGWGLGVSSSDLDSAAFAQAIADADAEGFKSDGIINDVRKAGQWIDEILKSCRGSRDFRAGKYTVAVDKAAASVATFDRSNIFLEEVYQEDADSRTNSVELLYRFRYGVSGGKYTGIITRNDATSQEAIGFNSTRLERPLISDHTTAEKSADYFLNRYRYGENRVRFRTKRLGTLRKGQVFTLSYPTKGFVDALFYADSIKITRDFAVIEGVGYSDDIFDTTSETHPSDPVADQIIPGSEIALPPNQISNLVLTSSSGVRTDGTVFAWIDGTFTKGRNHLLAEIQISEDAGTTWAVVGTTTAATFRHGPVNPGTSYLVRVIATGTNGQAAAVTSDPITTAGAPGPADVTGFSAAQDTLDLRKVNFAWNPVTDKDLAYYEVRKGLVWETSPIIGNQVAGTKFDYFESANGTYTYLVKAVDTSGNYSANASPRSVSMVIFPSDVTGFIASQNGERILLAWNPVSDLDLFGYEVREGASWELGQAVIDTTTDITALIDANFERTYTFWIKAKSRRRSYSEIATSATLTVGGLLPKNYVVVRDEIANPSGVHNQTEIGAPFWTFDNMPGTFDEYPNLGFNDFPGQAVLKLATNSGTIPEAIEYDEISAPSGSHSGTEISPTNFSFDKLIGTFADYADETFELPTGDTLKLTNVGGVFGLSGSYTVQYDLGGSRSVQVDADWAFVDVPAGSTATLELRVSNDGVSWGAWQPFLSGVKAGRYFEFRLGINNTSISYSPEVSRLVITFAPYTDEDRFFDSGDYTVQYDLGQPTTCDVAVDKFLFILPPGVSATLYSRYSVDGTTWSVWELFSPRRLTFRYIEFKMVLATDDNTQTPEVVRFSVAIDVPDIDQKGTSVVPLAGETVLFPAPYNLVPALVVTAEGSDAKADYSDVTNTGFFVQVVRATDGTALDGRTINWISKGY